MPKPRFRLQESVPLSICQGELAVSTVVSAMAGADVKMTAAMAARAAEWVLLMPSPCICVKYAPQTMCQTGHGKRNRRPSSSADKAKPRPFLTGVRIISRF